MRRLNPAVIYFLGLGLLFLAIGTGTAEKLLFPQSYFEHKIQKEKESLVMTDEQILANLEGLVVLQRQAKLGLIGSKDLADELILRFKTDSVLRVHKRDATARLKAFEKELQEHRDKKKERSTLEHFTAWFFQTKEPHSFWVDAARIGILAILFGIVRGVIWLWRNAGEKDKKKSAEEQPKRDSEIRL